MKPQMVKYALVRMSSTKRGFYSDAVPLMEKAVEMNGASSVNWGNLGDAYRWAPESRPKAAEAYKHAITLAEPQLALNPNNVELRAQLAAYYAKLPDKAKALAEIAQARRLAPTHATVLFKAAMVYEINGRRDQAISALDLAIQAGYSKVEIRREPEFAELRRDPRYQALDQQESSHAAGKLAH
jgi:serine/threonine-protein kinase